MKTLTNILLIMLFFSAGKSVMAQGTQDITSCISLYKKIYETKIQTALNFEHLKNFNYSLTFNQSSDLELQNSAKKIISISDVHQNFEYFIHLLCLAKVTISSDNSSTKIKIPDDTIIMFLGDLIDDRREIDAETKNDNLQKTLQLMSDLLTQYPQNFYYVIGNHEIMNLLMVMIHDSDDSSDKNKLISFVQKNYQVMGLQQPASNPINTELERTIMLIKYFYQDFIMNMYTSVKITQTDSNNKSVTSLFMHAGVHRNQQQSLTKNLLIPNLTINLADYSNKSWPSLFPLYFHKNYANTVDNKITTTDFNFLKNSMKIDNLVIGHCSLSDSKSSNSNEFTPQACYQSEVASTLIRIIKTDTGMQFRNDQVLTNLFQNQNENNLFKEILPTNSLQCIQISE